MTHIASPGEAAAAAFALHWLMVLGFGCAVPLAIAVVAALLAALRRC